jgi:broad specificity phosphatase PhoE
MFWFKEEGEEDEEQEVLLLGRRKEKVSDDLSTTTTSDKRIRIKGITMTMLGAVAALCVFVVTSGGDSGVLRGGGFESRAAGLTATVGSGREESELERSDDDARPFAAPQRRESMSSTGTATTTSLGVDDRASSSSSSSSFASLGNGAKEEERSVFVAVRDLFKYESRILVNSTPFSSSSVDASATAAKRNYELDDGALFGASRQWGSIRAKLNLAVNETSSSRENGRKLFLFVRHGEATHNAWGERRTGEAPLPNEQVPCTDEVTGKSLLDPSLTQVGLHEATESGKALGTYLEKAFKESEEEEAKKIAFFTSPQARAIETSRVAVLHTSSVKKYQSASEKSIRVSDLLRNKIDLTVPFEVRRPYSFEDDVTGDPIRYGGLSRALAKREEKYLEGCEFTKTLEDITSIHENDDYEIVREDVTRETKCRLGEATSDSVFTCADELGLLVNSDGELRYESNELTIQSVRDRMRVWFANVFEEERDAKVIVAFVHSDVIEGALKELFGEDMKSEYNALNGDVVPVLVKDVRPKEYLNFWNETDY